jgi:hypothetical protein
MSDGGGMRGGHIASWWDFEGVHMEVKYWELGGTWGWDGGDRDARENVERCN